MAAPALALRPPPMRWMVIAAIAALCVQGLCWFAARVLMGDMEAVGEAQRQMGLALFWMIGVLVFWLMEAPASRLHAIVGVLTSALLLTLLGSIAALAKLVFIDGVQISGDLLSSFGTLSLLLLLAQLILALPAAVVLQAIALTRVKE